MHRFFIAVAAMALTFSAVAKDKQYVDQADTVDKFAAQAASIRHDMQAGGRFEFIANDQKEAANHDLDAMNALLQKSGSVSAMPQADKLQLFNLQEHLNGILAHNDSERLVCEQVKSMGSNIPQTKCRTYGEIQRDRQRTQNMLIQNEQRPSFTRGN